MIFKYLEAGPIATNCYIIGDEKTREAVVVDPGGDVDRILLILSQHELTVKYIINTHSHFDHIGGNAELHRVTGAPILIHSTEKQMLSAMSSMAQGFGINSEPSPAADGTLEEGDVIKVGEIEMKVIHTPGHSPGGISLVIEGKKMVLVGDTLFQFSIGRTDFPGASHKTLINSIKTKLVPLGDDYEVYPGHGPPTTIGRERKVNPFLQEESPFI
jgi:hydroxyacylglutathione hydrolase